MMKWIKRGIFAGLALLFLVLVGVYLFLGSIVKKGIEKVGPEMTQTEVHVRFVGISPLSGSGHLRAMSIGNPKGYSSAKAIQFKEFKVRVAPGSLTKPVTVVQSVYIDSPEITYEHGPGGTNFDVIQRNVESFAKRFDSGGNATVQKPKSEKKVIIEDLLIRNAKANAFGVSITLPEIHLTNLGKDSGGIKPAEAVNRVLSSVTRNIASSLGYVAETGKKAVGGVVSGVKGGLKNLFRK